MKTQPFFDTVDNNYWLDFLLATHNHISLRPVAYFISTHAATFQKKNADFHFPSGIPVKRFESSAATSASFKQQKTRYWQRREQVKWKSRSISAISE